MSILCVLLGLFQLVILVALTGVLFSVAAVSRLMEVTITLIYPFTVFMLRQSSKLVIRIVIGIRAPEVQYVVNLVPDSEVDTRSLLENITVEEEGETGQTAETS